MPVVWKEVAKEAAKEAVRLLPLGGVIVSSIEQSTSLVDAASNKSIEALREEVAKQEIRLEFDLKQAKIAQELAIAQRILNAEIVEIEEFYDRSGSGHAGAKGDEKGITIGLGGEGKSVVKRVYKFTAGRPDAEDELISGSEKAS